MKRKMLYISQSFYPSPGGVSTLLYNLVNEFHEDFEITVMHLGVMGSSKHALPIDECIIDVNAFDKRDLESYASFKEFLYKDFHNLESISGDVRDLEGYASYMRVIGIFTKRIQDILDSGESFDIIHVHDYQVLPALKGLKTRAKTIFSLHAPVHEMWSLSLRRWMMVYVSEFDTICLSAPEYCELFSKFFSHGSVLLVEPVTGRKYLHDTAPVRLKETFRFLCVQRFDAKSGQKQVADAFMKAFGYDDSVELLFVGEGSLTSSMSLIRDSYIDMIKRSVRGHDNIVFLGNVDYLSLQHYYEKSDVFVMFSKMECFGLAVSEAMSRGKPIIATSVGGLKYQVLDGYNGFLAEPGDVEYAATILRRLFLNASLTMRLGRNSRKRYLEVFHPDIILKKYRQLYD